ncbi:MAG: hypothetical protein AAF471_06960, partial [Myxococcota bacterium]
KKFLASLQYFSGTPFDTFQEGKAGGGLDQNLQKTSPNPFWKAPEFTLVKTGAGMTKRRDAINRVST